MALVGDVEELDIVWDMLYTCYDLPEKYIVEALEPVMKFMKFKVLKPDTFENSSFFSGGGKFCSGN